MEFAIEDNVPLPSHDLNGPKPGRVTETILKLEVGQSFFLEGLKDADRSRIGSCIKTAKRSKPEALYALHIVPGGLRVWRTQ